MNRLVAVLSTALLFAAGATMYLWLQHRDDLAELAALQARLGAAGMAPDISRARPQGHDAPPSMEAPAAQQLAEAEETHVQLAALRKSRNQHDDRDIRRGQILVNLPRRYPDLAAELHLSEQEENSVFGLIATQHLESGERVDALLDTEAPGSAAAQEIRRRMDEAQVENARQMAAVLGSKYPQWQEYEKALPTRMQVRELQAALGSGRDALGAAQAKALITALAVEQVRARQEQREARTAGTDPRELARRHTEANRRLLVIAAEHLTPAQLDPYKRMLERQASLAAITSEIEFAAGQARATQSAPR